MEVLRKFYESSKSHPAARNGSSTQVLPRFQKSIRPLEIGVLLKFYEISTRVPKGIRPLEIGVRRKFHESSERHAAARNWSSTRDLREF